MTNNGPRSTVAGEVLMSFRTQVNDMTANIEVTVGPAGPALDGFLSRGRASWTAKPVYKVEEPSVMHSNGTEYHLHLQPSS